jgi:hypothetical protein
LIGIWSIVLKSTLCQGSDRNEKEKIEEGFGKRRPVIQSIWCFVFPVSGQHAAFPLLPKVSLAISSLIVLRFIHSHQKLWVFTTEIDIDSSSNYWKGSQHIRSILRAAIPKSWAEIRIGKHGTQSEKVSDQRNRVDPIVRPTP